MARSYSACCSHFLKKKSTFKTTSSCTNMESYSHRGIDQQIHQRNRESARLFFSPNVFHPSIKKRRKSRHAATSIQREVHGAFFPSKPAADCQVQSGSFEPFHRGRPVGRRCAFLSKQGLWRRRRAALLTPCIALRLNTNYQRGHMTLRLIDSVIKNNWQGPRIIVGERWD